MFDKNGSGYINTNDVCNLMRKELKGWKYDKFVQIVNRYGSTINYIDMFQKNKWML